MVVCGTMKEITTHETEAAVVTVTSIYISVCSKNASAARNRFLGGKTFFSMADALAAYKSEKVRSAINEAYRIHTA